MVGPKGAESSEEPGDSVLMRSHLAGDSLAFPTLVRRHQPWMWAVANAALGSREDAMDAVQLAFMRALHHAHTWREDGPLGAWLHRIVARVVLDTYSTREREPTPIDTEDNQRFEELITADNTEGAASERVVQDVIMSLPVGYREAFVRTSLLGFTTAEVASDLGLPEGTVKSRKARGKVRLVEALRDAGLIGPRRST